MIDITLTQKQHSYIIGLLPNLGHKDIIRYINQVSKVFVAGNDLSNITVTIPEDLINEVYHIMGTHQERLANASNVEIKKALLPQVVANPVIVAALQARDQESKSMLSEVLKSANDFILSLK